MALARTRSWRGLGMVMGDRRGSDGKNRTIFWGRVHMIDSRGRENLALMYFIGTESQGERV